MEQRFYSNGKLFIIGEYVVLDGADAFALPTKGGQELVVRNGSKLEMHWKSYDFDGSIWFEDCISFSDIISNAKSDLHVKNTLVEILHQANKSNSGILSKSSGFSITTHLTFPRKWGLGTSSTLINNIADWFEIDPFELLQNSFGGSGYDIACARNNTPILYNTASGNPTIKSIEFLPDFLDRLYFVYLNQKQDSKSAIAAYRAKAFDVEALVQKANALTEIVTTTNDIDKFCSALQSYEDLLSDALQQKTVKQLLFSDFKGTLRSLGAWGGDFILAVSQDDPSDYFKAKGYQTVIPYKDMIL